MRPDLIASITRKELLEALRDRRTLFMMVVLPILLYPALLLLVTQVAMVQQQKLEAEPSRVAIVAEAPPEALIEALTDENIELSVYAPSIAPDVRDDEHDVVIDALAWEDPDAGGSVPIDVQFESVDDASRLAVDRVEALLMDWSDAEVTRRLEAAGLGAETIEPLAPELVDRSARTERGGYLLGAMLPIFMIITVMLGALYPSIDLTAGERERSTIQTLFTAPVSPVEIVAGKYLAVVGIALLSGFANLLGMVLVFGQGLLLAPEILDQLDVSLPPSVIVGMMACIVLLALLLSAVLMTVAILAPSFKDAQTYVTPVYLVCIVPAMIAQMPGFVLDETLALVPAVNVVLLMKQMLLEGVQPDSFVLVAGATLVQASLVLVVAGRLFGQEAVVIGDRGTFRLLMAPSEIVPRPRPSIGEAVAWYAIGFLLLYYVGATVQQFAPRPGLILTLWGLVFAPTVLVARYLKVDFVETFHLRRPTVRAMVAATLLGVSGIVVVNVLNGVVSDLVLPQSDAFAEQFAQEMERFFPPPENAFDWIALLALVAVSPAICEEALFRGFLLASVRDRVSPAVAAAVTAIAFGLFHLSIYRLFGTTVLGLLMAALVLRSGSIWPAVWLHALNNGLAVVAQYGIDAEPAEAEAMLIRWLPGACLLFVAGLVALFWPDTPGRTPPPEP